MEASFSFLSLIFFVSFFASDCVRNPSRCFVKRSAVLFFVPTRLTDGRFSRVHCCLAKHCISMCLSPPGPLRCRRCLAESESISRRLKRCSELFWIFFHFFSFFHFFIFHVFFTRVSFLVFLFFFACVSFHF